ncbi:MAG: sigma-70 family RNA polymerase sigma factor [Acidimicrobiia bacterium]|nr:sigma-70 family RNA polymerase sigma factor [Acidimicrobiia bacterium]
MSRRAGFDDWYRRTRPTLVRSLLVATAGDPDVAADAADEAMVRAYERWPRIREMASPEGWVYRVGLNVARRRFRRRATEQRAVARHRAGRSLTVPAPDGGDRVALWEAVARLDRRTREIVALRYVAGLTESEIAELLGGRTGTISSVLSRARARLRDELTDAAEPRRLRRRGGPAVTGPDPLERIGEPRRGRRRARPHARRHHRPPRRAAAAPPHRVRGRSGPVRGARHRRAAPRREHRRRGPRGRDGRGSRRRAALRHRRPDLARVADRRRGEPRRRTRAGLRA